MAHLVREFRYHHSQQVEEIDGGGVRMVMVAAGLPEIAAWTAGFGGNARPVEPAELVEMVREIHQGGLAAFDAVDPI